MDGHLITVTSHGGRDKGALWGLFYKGTNGIRRVPPSWSNHLPEAPTPKTIMLVIKFQPMNFGEIHSMYNMHMCVLSHSVVSDSLDTKGRFYRPWTIAHQAPLSMGLSRQEYWSGLPFPSPGDLPNLGIEPSSLWSPALEGESFTTMLPGKSLNV